MVKKLISLALVIVMLFCLVPSVFAASDEAQQAAEDLHELGLFNGTGTDENGNPIYDLDRTPSRAEAVTMLVALLGKSDEAKSTTWDTPFTDVPNWAKPYVGYAYVNGLTSGTSATTFGSSLPVTASQFLTFVLKALGYESGTDFKWNAAWELSDAIGLTDGRYNASTKTFLRGDVAIISLSCYNIQKTLKTAPYFGLPEDIKWNTSPTTEDDLCNNVLYSFLFGNYSLYFSKAYTVTPTSGSMANMMRTIVKRTLSYRYPELAGVFCNTFVGCGTDDAGNMFIDFPKSSLTNEQIYSNQQAALAKAIEIKDSLHDSGKIKDGMTQLQIAQVYYDYLVAMKVTPSENGEEASKLGTSVEYDSPYACLVNRKADCVGRAGAFNLLMHLEGITAQGVHGEIKGTNCGHVLSSVVLDGSTYYCDWGNHYPMSQDISSWFEFK